ncbi:MAG TPA: 3-deoxy-8-phosphooctulonate synthase [Blastocatellia bacterium]|nr:3-deoxy-8-phosphooctulonate synthase [Blastocatellia bacterium]
MNSFYQTLQPRTDVFFLIAGPCVIESESHALKMAAALAAITTKLDIPYIFKASYDKANRSSISSFRGLGMEEGLRVLETIKREIGVPVLTDIHESQQVAAVAAIADVLQIPAFLCRQTDLLIAAAQSGRIVNVKKGQFLAPWEMRNVINKLEAAGGKELLLTERGSCFGYNNLVVDMRSLPIMRSFVYPVVYDATHSLQLPGGLGEATAGMAEYIPNLARAAVACGIDGLFMEVHDNPAQALSDATTQFPLEKLEGLLTTLLRVHSITSR